VSHALEAIRLRALGFHPIVERTNSKMPAEMGWQKLVNRTDEELRRVFEQMSEGGIGTVTHGFVVIDIDVRQTRTASTALFRLADRARPPCRARSRARRRAAVGTCSSVCRRHRDSQLRQQDRPRHRHPRHRRSGRASADVIDGKSYGWLDAASRTGSA
jgi:hypothetical protein